MSFLCCISRSNATSQSPAPNNHQRGHPSPTTTTTTNGDDRDDGYNPITPLPRYTARPLSIQEKTLEMHLRDPPISSSSYPDKKHQHEYDPHHQHQHQGGEVTPDDDASSAAFSFQSSYGNTSTATRETPPPPYSPRQVAIDSPVPSRPMSILELDMPPMMHVAQPRPVFRRPESVVRGLEGDVVRPRRASWESQSGRG